MSNRNKDAKRGEYSYSDKVLDDIIYKNQSRKNTGIVGRIKENGLGIFLLLSCLVIVMVCRSLMYPGIAESSGDLSGARDFGGDITSVVINYDGNDYSATDGETISIDAKSSDSIDVKITLNYEFNNGAQDDTTKLGEDQTVIYYQLDDAFEIISDISALVYDGADAVGTAYIYTDGTVKIVFNDDYIKDKILSEDGDKTVKGYVTMNAVINRNADSSGDKESTINTINVDVKFPTKTVDIAKSGNITSDSSGNKYQTWTVNIDNYYPTENNLEGYTLSDSITATGITKGNSETTGFDFSSHAEGTSVEITATDTDGNKVTLSQDDFEYDSDGNIVFSEEQSKKYTNISITYKTLITDLKDSVYATGGVEYNNEAKLTKENEDTKSAKSKFEFKDSVSVQKTGQQDYNLTGNENGVVTWTVTVSDKNNQPLSGISVTDNNLKNATGMKIGYYDGGSFTEITDYTTDSEGKITFGDDVSQTSVVIIYTTALSESEKTKIENDEGVNLSNTAKTYYKDVELGTTTTNVTYENQYDLYKTGTYNYDGEVKWTITVNANQNNCKSSLNGYTITDAAIKDMSLSDLEIGNFTYRGSSMDYTVTVSGDTAKVTDSSGDLKATITKNGDTLTITETAPYDGTNEWWFASGGRLHGLTVSYTTTVEDGVTSVKNTVSDNKYNEDTEEVDLSGTVSYFKSGIKKVWDDGNSTSRPDINVVLQRQEVKSGNSVSSDDSAWTTIKYDSSASSWAETTDSDEDAYITLTSTGGYITSVANLPNRKEGEMSTVYHYRIKEITELEGYTTSYSNNDITESSSDATMVVTNTRDANYSKEVYDKYDDLITNGSEVSMDRFETYSDGTDTWYMIKYVIRYDSADITIKDTLPDLKDDDGNYLITLDEGECKSEPQQSKIEADKVKLGPMVKEPNSVSNATNDHYYYDSNNNIVYFGTHMEDKMTKDDGYIVYYLKVKQVETDDESGSYKFIKEATSESDSAVITNSISVDGGTTETSTISVTPEDNNRVITKGVTDQVTTSDGYEAQGGLIEYYLVVNPNGDRISGGEKYEIVDTIECSNSSVTVNLNSIKVEELDENGNVVEKLSSDSDYTYNVTYSDSGAVLKLYVPDEKALKITYDYQIYLSGKKPTVGSKYTFTNTASLNTKSVIGKDVAKDISFSVTDAAAGVSTDTFSLRKVDINSYGLDLSAKFLIAQYDGNGNWVYATNEDVTDEVKGTSVIHDIDFESHTDDNGVAYNVANFWNNGWNVGIEDAAKTTAVPLSDDLYHIENSADGEFLVQLENNKIYKLVEVSIPNSYEGSNIEFPCTIGGYTYKTFEDLVIGYLNYPSRFDVSSSDANNFVAQFIKSFVSVRYFVYGEINTWEYPTGVTSDNVIIASGTTNISNNKLIEVTAKKTWLDSFSGTWSSTVALYWSYEEVTDGYPDDMKLVTAEDLGLIGTAATNSYTKTIKSTDEVKSYTWTDLPSGKDNKPIYYYIRETSYTIDGVTYTYDESTGKYLNGAEEGEYRPVYAGNGGNVDSTSLEISNANDLTVEKTWLNSNGTEMKAPADKVQFKIYGYRTGYAKETLYKSGYTSEDGEAYSVFTLNENNKWTINISEEVGEAVVNKYDSFEVEELNVPDGYKVSYYYDVNDSYGTITITNRSITEAAYTLPVTGGAGRNVVVLMGALLMSVSAVLLVNKCKNNHADI